SPQGRQRGGDRARTVLSVLHVRNRLFSSRVGPRSLHGRRPQWLRCLRARFGGRDPVAPPSCPGFLPCPAAREGPDQRRGRRARAVDPRSACSLRAPQPSRRGKLRTCANIPIPLPSIDLRSCRPPCGGAPVPRWSSSERATCVLILAPPLPLRAM